MFKKLKDSFPYGTVDERTKAIAYQGDAYAYRFLMFAILLDVAFREITAIKTSWDLLILVIVAGGISTFYQIKHRIIFNDSNFKQGLFFFLLTMGIAAIVAIITVILV